MRRLVPAALTGVLVAAPAGAQTSDLAFAASAADSILSSGVEVGLEAFRGDSVTGVYLRGDYRGEIESVAYGIDARGQRYLWFSVERNPTVKLVAMLMDVDLDVAPDFLLFRIVDEEARVEEAVEYRGPAARDAVIDIQFQSACARPRCDPAGWTVRPRTRREVPPDFFRPWRAPLGLAAARGETWLGEPRSTFAARAPETPAPPPAGADP